jgi:hypothetical protein
MCPYPTSWMKTKDGRGRMSDDLYKKIILDLKSQNFKGEFIPYLGNETFMDPDILDRIELALSHLSDVSLVVDSNMSMLSEEKIDRLYELYESNGFKGKFTISHHGVDRLTMEAIMGIPYEKCVENIIYLIKKFDNKLNIIVHACCDFKDSDVDLDGVFADAEAGRKKMTKDALDRVTWGNVKRYWHKMITENKLPTKTLTLDRLVPNSKANRAPNTKSGQFYKNLGRRDCPRIKGFFHVMWNGEATLCCRTVYRHEEDVILGDLTENTIEEVLASDQCHTAYEMVRGNIESRPDHPCKRC